MTRSHSTGGRHRLAAVLILTTTLTVPVMIVAPAHANNYGESYPGGGEVPMLARASVSLPMAGTVLTNRQVNTGAVAAKTIAAAGVALNCGCTSDSRIGVTDNTGAASAYGNTALNGATVNGNGQPLALVSNAQVNRGPVSATVVGHFGASMTGGANAGLVTITGNSLAATAIGNQAVNALTASR